MPQDVRKQAIADYATAFVAFALITGVLLWFVRIKPPAQKNGGKVQISKIYSLSTDMEQCQPNHRQLIKWLPILDPSRIATTKANSPYLDDNWISARHFLGLRKKALPTRSVDFEAVPSYVFPFRQPMLREPQELTPGGLITDSQWPIPPERNRPIELGVNWFRADMTPLQYPPMLSVTGLEKPKGINRLACIMEISFPRGRTHFPRVTLSKRSGTPSFDHAVVKQCIRWLRRRAFDDADFAPPDSVVVVWEFDQEPPSSRDVPPPPADPGSPKPGDQPEGEIIISPKPDEKPDKDGN